MPIIMMGFCRQLNPQNIWTRPTPISAPSLLEGQKTGVGTCPQLGGIHKQGMCHNVARLLLPG